MFSHVLVGSNDIDRSKKFYDATLAALGYGPPVENNGRYFYMSKTGTFAIGKPIDGEDACHANGGTIGFAAGSPEQADAWHKAGVENGGRSIEDDPGIREGGLGKLYLAYLRDPDGNKLCAMHRIKG